MVSIRAQQRLRTSRRSTVAGLGGVLLMAIGLVLTVTGGTGLVFPTVLALLGGLLLVIGIASGTLLVFENFRFRRDQSYYDPDDEDDE